MTSSKQVLMFPVFSFSSLFGCNMSAVSGALLNGSDRSLCVCVGGECVHEWLLSNSYGNIPSILLNEYTITSCCPVSGQIKAIQCSVYGMLASLPWEPYINLGPCGTRPLRCSSAIFGILHSCWAITNTYSLHKAFGSDTITTFTIYMTNCTVLAAIIIILYPVVKVIAV